MRPCSDLEKLFDAFAYRLLRIRRLFDAVNSRPLQDRDIVLANSVIELDNLVLGTMRQFLISSLRGARTKDGSRVKTTASFADEGEISAFILSILNSQKHKTLKYPTSIKRGDEPTIRDPRDVRKVLDAIKASNLGSVDNALALNSPIFRDLGTIRNFYAHRNADTWRKAKAKAVSVGALNVNHANDFVLMTLAPRPVSVFQDWLDDAEFFFDELTK